MTPGVQHHAVAVGDLIRSVMADRKMTRRRLAELMGYTPTCVGFWLQGRALPSLEQAERIAEHLGDDRIRQRVRAARIGVCAYVGCQRPFDRVQGRRNKFCGPKCQMRANYRASNRVDPRQVAIAAFCRECEPEGICRMLECPLRGFSPLPFIPLHRVAA